MKHHQTTTCSPNRRHVGLFATLAALAMFTTTTASASTNVWLGANGVNWSESSNWTNGVPAAGDDVRFLDSGSTNTPVDINNVVDAGIALGSIHFGNTNNSHNTQIPAGVVLSITNVGALTMFTPTEAPVSKLITNSVSGNGALVISNASGRIALNQGSASAPSRATLNLSGLDTLDLTARSLGLGSSFSPNAAGAATRYGGQLFLAKTNTISLSLTDTLANYQTLTSRTNAIEIVRAPGNNPGITCQLWLGQTNSIFLDSLGCGMDKSGNNSTASSGLIAFNPAFTNNSPGAYFRGVGGGAATRIKWWSIGDGNNSSSSSNGGRGTNDFSNGTVDMLVDVMSLGRECNAGNTGWAGPHSGMLIFNRGVVDVNTIYAGNQSFTQPTSVPGAVGIIIVNGPGALLRVNSALNLGYTTGTSGTALKTSGILNVQGGTALVNQINVGAASTTNLVILNGGTLTLSNTIASPARGLLTFATTNATLRLTVTGVTNIVTTNLVMGGASNVISAPDVAIFSSYPRQIALIKYTTLTGTYNFLLDPATLSGAAPDAYLSNNVANSTIDLVLPTDPRPGGTVPSSYSGSPGDNVTFTVTPSGAAPLAYQWRYGGAPLADGPTGNGSTLSGSSTTSLSITSAQPADNGNYDLVITNPYGSFTSVVAVLTISAGDVAPLITGPNNQTVIQSNNATFTASVSGVPAPALQWQKNGVDIPGETSSTLTITNAQYPADQATYSIIATNVAGAATNSATLTVIVPPVITTHPVSLTVTNTQPASFSVTATGVPAPTYQWKKNGNNITDATNATLNFTPASPADIGTYSVVVQNDAGSVTSSNATLIVNSTMVASSLTPANGASAVFYDTPLTITFSQPPSLRSAGTIKIYAATNSVTPVDTINLALGNPQQRLFPGDGQSFTYNYVVIIGSTATIYPRFNVMSSNQTYYVTVDNGVFTDSTGAYFVGITDTNAWRFTTKPTGPADPNSVVVAADGSGDFLTVQGAVNYVPGGNTTPRLISIRNGDYNEIVNISGKHNLTLRGQSRTGVLIGYTNNASFQSANSGTTHARMAFKVNANDIAIETLTITNRTAQGGSQAESLMVESNAKRCIVNNADIVSRQDTILGNETSSQAYFYNSTVRGNFDFIWGGGNFYFDKCTIHNISGTGSGNITAARTGTSASQTSTYQWPNPGSTYSANGFSFVDCDYIADAGLGNITLAGGNGTAGNLVSWVGCSFATNYVTPSAGLFSGNYLFWQYQNTDLSNNPVSFSSLTTLTNDDPRLLAATNVTTWFYGWTPQLAPNIVTNPVGSYLAPGGTVNLNVAATGIPEPAYQWLKNGTNVPGATGATLSLPGAVAGDSGSYSVVVSNAAGSVTSIAVTVTVNTSPVASNVTAITVTDTPLSLSAAKLALFGSDADGDALVLAGVSATSTNGGSVNWSGGSVTYTPAGGFTGTDSFSYTLSDGRGGTAVGEVTVTVTAASEGFNQVAAENLGGGTVRLSYLGIPGNHYALDWRTNLSVGTWQALFTNAAATNGWLIFTNTSSEPQNFYRTRFVP